MSDVTIRHVQELDIDGIEAIDEAVTGSYRPGHWEHQVRYYLTRPHGSAVVAENADGRLVGFLFGDIRGWEFGFETPTGWIEVLGVLPDQQKGQIGQQMAAAVFDFWRANGVSSARTLVENSASDIAGFMGKLGMTVSNMTAYEMSL